MPVRHIFVGVDGSCASLAALGWAGRLAGAGEADVTSIYAFMPPLTDAPLAAQDALRKEAEERLTLLSADIGSPVPVSPLVVDGNPEAILPVVAQRADLLVVGTRGARGVARLHFGSVAHRLAHRVSVPMAIVPVSAARDRVARIVVGVNGSAGSAAAVAFCATVAPLIGARVVAVYAFEPFAEWVPQDHPLSWHRTAEADVRRWVAPIKEAGVPVEVDVRRDIHPVGALCAAIDSAPDTLAVVGARRRGGVSGLRRSRVPIQLVHHRSAVVVMVPSAGAGVGPAPSNDLGDTPAVREDDVAWDVEAASLGGSFGS